MSTDDATHRLRGGRGVRLHCAGDEPDPANLRLIVRNGGAFDAVVYIVRQPGATGVRIGSITANTTQALELRHGYVPLDDVLMLAVHPIGTNATWTSASVILQSGTVPVLDLPIGVGGDCSGCALHVLSRAAALHIIHATRR